MLQWGHAEHSVEDPAPDGLPSPTTRLQWGHAEHSVEDSPPRGHLQNSGLHDVPREPTAAETPAIDGDFGRLTEVVRSQAFPIRERGARSFFLITTELPKGLGRESRESPFSRQYHSRRDFAQKKTEGRVGSWEQWVSRFICRGFSLNT